MPRSFSPLSKEKKGFLNEAYLMIEKNIFADIPEFEVNKESLEERLKKQSEITGRSFNKRFIKSAQKGLVPGVGIGFGIDRLVSYLTNKPIIKIINNGFIR